MAFPGTVSNSYWGSVHPGLVLSEMEFFFQTKFVRFLQLSSGRICAVGRPMLCDGVLSFRVSGRQWSVENTWPGFYLRVRRLLGQIQKYLIKLLFRKRDNPR